MLTRAVVVLCALLSCAHGKVLRSKKQSVLGTPSEALEKVRSMIKETIAQMEAAQARDTPHAKFCEKQKKALEESLGKAKEQVSKGESAYDVIRKNPENSMEKKDAARHELTALREELDSLRKADEALKAECLYNPSTFEERDERRQDEISALKEALDAIEAFGSE
uniref:Tubulin-specific chaperone A n=1 Tax=Chromera velia CCMP2878 TaxID=1169474 RepID=A0A0G4I837_9ALVE|eukprot:Cvel_11848.t1-p1 / transcript=Cvel_11848.t1 / gene=Cvel_11848 / organism=Chromera_velia_CCMP2878 / gene_product=hypothetical protein / transcript_product=hypothetical protein / location=Cvel_scaffold755:47095-48955(-) / protein_length=165 / sequence_SO=supercontig / SO=protein_coding / is_pseudo=false